jgi:hypothetical protein
MITMTDVSWLRDCSGPRLSDTPNGGQAHVPFRERNITPTYAPSTGVVRPQAGVAVVADVAQGKAHMRVRHWRPPV